MYEHPVVLFLQGSVTLSSIVWLYLGADVRVAEVALELILKVQNVQCHRTGMLTMCITATSEILNSMTSAWLCCLSCMPILECLNSAAVARD